ncbi:HupE/UreJ family protein [Neotabrizicola shimadae]|uniref:HupE/UreJ family protein n=1 Tax=Neotabrizicola shimadae TaxID=2807096 RepID=A0A8G0ZSM5_9RHOB|nr:HupE/UreJ family protein [Neotabrizicola shimadae]QYZ70681.1 HupE/UreJ family protein [Neotabrizicola shimadae]
MKKLAVTAVVALAAGPALAHTGQGDAHGFLHGVLHPLTGPDHLLAMLAVGLWSGFVLPNRFWMGAATFMGAMALGAGLSWAGIAYPAVETVILASVIVFGLLVLLSRPGQPQWQTAASLGAIALFASAHGHAHATEATGTIAAYLSGFLISTLALHLAGIGIARSIANRTAARVLQGGMGLGIAASGLYLLMAG